MTSSALLTDEVVFLSENQSNSAQSIFGVYLQIDPAKTIIIFGKLLEKQKNNIILSPKYIVSKICRRGGNRTFDTAKQSIEATAKCKHKTRSRYPIGL